MLAPSTEISKEPSSVLHFFHNWLQFAGDYASVTPRTLKVQDEAAYNALVEKGWLPDNWKKSDTGATVLFENNGK